MVTMELIRVRNPHSVLAVLENRPEDCVEISLPGKDSSPAWAKVREAARSRKVRIVAAGSDPRDKKSNDGRASLSEAKIKTHEGLGLEEFQ